MGETTQLHERGLKEKLWNNKNRKPAGKENSLVTSDIKIALKEHISASRAYLASIREHTKHKEKQRKVKHVIKKNKKITRIELGEKLARNYNDIQ